MTENEFLRGIEELLELDAGSLKSEDRLDAIPWDSLAVLGFISMVDQRLGIQLRPTAIAASTTLSDLYSQIAAHVA